MKAFVDPMGRQVSLADPPADCPIVHAEIGGGLSYSELHDREVGVTL